jgi:hypothetical protein
MDDSLKQFTAQTDSIAQVMDQHKMRFSITFPGKIIETNATTIDGNTAIWEYTLKELQTNQPDQVTVFE